MSLQKLPSELLGSITDHLKRDHPPSLFNLALVNKSFYTWYLPIINSLLFSEVILDVKTGIHQKTGIHEIFQSLDKKLEKAHGFEHVRQLVIREHECSPKPNDNEWHPPKTSDIKGELFQQPDYPWLWYKNQLHECIKRFTPAVEFKTGIYDFWQPLVDLIRKLPKLDDLQFICERPFPMTVLDALHQYQPQCRLHLWIYEFRSLHNPQTESDEFRLVSSPLLHSISLEIQCPGKSLADPKPCYQREALRRVVQLAPNLKTATVDHTHGLWPMFDFDWHPNPPGFTKFPREEEMAVTPKLGSLTCLVLHDHDNIEPETLEAWSKVTDFSKLEFLHIGSVTQETLEFATWKCSFPSLKGLRLNLIYDRRSFDFFGVASQFVQSLPPLEELYIDGWHSLLPVESIVERHGSRLRTLHLTYSMRYANRCLTESDVKQIASHCPLLEDLNCKIQRSLGDASEVRIYRALGTIPRLRFLKINFCAFDPALHGGEEDEVWSYVPPWTSEGLEHPPAPSDPSFDEFENQVSDFNFEQNHRPRNGHVQRFLINSAVDKDLACAIFRTIASGKAPDSAPLLTLDLNFDERRDFFLFMHNWRVEPSPRDDDSSELTAWEPNKQPPRKGTLPPEWRENFRRLWPLPEEVQEEIQREKSEAERIEAEKNEAEKEKAPEKRKSKRASAGNWLKQKMLPVRGGPKLKGVMPSRNEAKRDSNWLNEWHSFPLATDSESES